MKKLFVVFVNNRPKGILTESEFEMQTNKYWDSYRSVDVPLKDWVEEKINIGNIKNYF